MPAPEDHTILLLYSIELFFNRLSFRLKHFGFAQCKLCEMAWKGIAAGLSLYMAHWFFKIISPAWSISRSRRYGTVEKIYTGTCFTTIFHGNAMGAESYLKKLTLTDQ